MFLKVELCFKLATMINFSLYSEALKKVKEESTQVYVTLLVLLQEFLCWL